tara:strand:+ start:139 stop:381 length:243 start_codon:yes stop_codon:yes gene_type:complete
MNADYTKEQLAEKITYLDKRYDRLYRDVGTLMNEWNKLFKEEQRMRNRIKTLEKDLARTKNTYYFAIIMLTILACAAFVQ